jgi:hypothetical protein
MLKKIGLTSLGIALLAAPALSSAQTTFDNGVVWPPPRQLDLPAEGAIPYYLGAGAAFDLLIAAHDIEEFACGIANIDTRQERP